MNIFDRIFLHRRKEAEPNSSTGDASTPASQGFGHHVPAVQLSSALDKPALIRLLPWITDASIDHIETFISELRGLGQDITAIECGAGSSTGFLAQRVSKLVSVEHDEDWHLLVRKIVEAIGTLNVEWRLEERPYWRAFNDYGDATFDIALIDGRDRSSCVQHVRRLLRPGGILVVDNTERISGIDGRGPYYEMLEYLDGWFPIHFEQPWKDRAGWTPPHRWITSIWRKPDLSNDIQYTTLGLPLQKAERYAKPLEDSMSPHQREPLNSVLKEVVTRPFREFAPELFYAWNINHTERQADRVIFHGWALPIDGKPQNTFLYVNGRKAELEWKNEENVHKIFPAWPNSLLTSFTATIECPTDHVQFILDIRSSLDEPLPIKYQMAVDLSDGKTIKIPAAELMSHIGSLPPQMFLLTGNTLAKQLDRALRSSTGKGFAERENILEWGCGSGRITQHVRQKFAGARSRVVGIDVDEPAISWCSQNVSAIDFSTCGLNPPCDFADQSFDTIYAYSVLSHLRRQDALDWISEIRRLLRPGGHFAFTTLGVSSLPWLMPNGNEALSKQLRNHGIYDGAKNTDIDGVISDSSYYRNTWVTDNYVRDRWANEFSVLFHERCFHHYQDLWILERPEH